LSRDRQKTKLRIAKGIVILSVVPILIHAYEYGPDAGAAGVPGENGSCSQSGCHTGTPVNGGGGSVTVTFPGDLTYTPGATQHLVVTIDDSKQRKWGFELTARLDSDVTQVAGSFSPTDRRTQLMCSSLDLVQFDNFNTACPNNLPLAYIEQTLAGYSANQPNPGKYEFDWNPPAADVGPVTIYVAANAANGDLTQNGDHIYTATYNLTAAGAAASPAITAGGISNAASQAIPGLPNSAIAQGSIFIINGNTLGLASAQSSGLPLQTSLGGTSVQVTVNGTSLAAPISSASATQITAIMPSGAPVGSGTVTVTFNGQTSAAEPVQVTPANFGIYTLNGSGTGPAQAVDSSGNAVTLTTPAKLGGTITLAGTGLGAISADDVSQPSKQDKSSSVTLYVGAGKAAVQYAGRAGAAPGQDQITFTIPGDAITGCYVPVAVVVNNITSNFASLAIAPDGSACSDGNGFTSAPSGNVKLATINLSRTASSPGPTTIDNGAAAFGAYTTSQLASSLGPFQAASVGGCLLFGFTGNSASVTDPIQPQRLTAGSPITIKGSNGDKQLAGSAGVYGAQLATSANGGKLYLDPGSYTVSAPDGADVGAFQAQVMAPPPIAWTNAASITSVNRSQGVTVTWTGGDPGGFVYVSGNSTLTNGTGAMFTCTAAASAGTFTVPPVVTLALPASSSGGLTLMGVSPPVSFTAPGIDIGLAMASSGVSQPEPFQ
jgi:uncharacterized protein (TIGR03437 family)